ncbi:2Fe-2S iron-sulfur cluster-binding protein [Pseudaestuariivita sp.]|uniref:2Fe-2S iron-sulfur cluster-binding protein n=1 Tax=Pseudaestuariivita sp. TaxID=2211669 RepID=UPI0040594416
MTRPRFHTLTIADVRRDTADAIELRFAVPEALREAYAFTPGQYLTLRAEVDGQDTRRSYSICAPVGSETLAVGIKRIDGGAFSSFAQSLTPGDQIDVMVPQGRFTAPVGGQHDYLLLAAGSGITPMVSIATSVLDGEPGSTVTLAYANRSTDQVMFRTALEDLKDRYLTRFLLTHVMDEEAQDVELFNGRLDAEKIDTMATRGLIQPLLYDAIYICGPQPMIEAASSALEALGVPKERIRYELFTPSTPMRTPPARKMPEGAAVDVVLDGARRTVRLKEGEAFLDAAQNAGLDIPYSCANGMCATCRCKLTEGQAEMIQNFSLEPWELEAGFMLACQMRPVSPRVAIDFDAV